MLLISSDARRSVTLHAPAEVTRLDADGNLHYDDGAIEPSAKRKYAVSAVTATGGFRTWQVTSKRTATAVRAAYKARGGDALILPAL